MSRVATVLARLPRVLTRMISETAREIQLREYVPSRALPCRWVLVFLLLAAIHCTANGQSSHGWILGRVRNARSFEWIAGAAVSLTTLDGAKIVETSTDGSGRYWLLWVAPGEVELKIEKSGFYSHVKGVRVESERGSLVDANMAEMGSGEPDDLVLNWAGIPINPWGTGYGTNFDRARLENLPSPRNIWALLENQVPSAIVDRIDEGGFGSGTIPLVSVRGASWAQNEYRLDGINITDPYDAGKPLLYPGFGSLIEFRASTAFHSSEVQVPGGSFDLATRSGGREYHGAAEAYYLGEPFESRNLDSRLRGFGFNSTPHFKRFGEGEFTFGGAVPRVREWAFFTDLGIQHLSKAMPEFTGTPTATVLSGLLRVDGKAGARDEVGGLATGQIVDNSELGAGAGVSPTATLRGHDRYEVIQGHWIHRQSAESAFELGFGFSHASPSDTFQRGITTSPSSVQLSSGRLGGAAPLESDAARSRFSLLGQGEVLRRSPGRLQHLLNFGLDVEEALDTESLRVFEDVQELFFPAGVPSEVIEFNTPSLTRQRLRDVSAYLDDQIKIAEWLFVRVGLNLDSSSARQLGGIGSVVSWTALAPRIGLAVPVLRRFGDTRLLARFARYYHALPAQYEGFANPD